MVHHLEHILENLPQGIVLLDSRYTVTFFNSRVSEILGLSKEVIQKGMKGDALLDATTCDRVPIDVHDRSARPLKAGVAESREFTLSDGRIVLVRCVPSTDGGWLLTYEDVSTLARIEDNLARQHQRFDAALKNMPHGLCMFDPDKRLVICNTAYARMYDLPDRLAQPGTPLEEILAYRHRMGSGPVNSARYFDVVAEAISKGALASQNTMLADGRVVKITHNPMQSGGYVATHEDVSETVRLADELVEHRDKLEATVRSRTEEIERQARELERLLDQERHINELQRQFVAMASHEFRTPLAIIDAAAQRLSRNKGMISADFINEKVGQIRASVSRIVDLMESILSAGRLDGGKNDLSYERCAIGALIRNCCDRQAGIGKTHRFLLDIGRLPEFADLDRRAFEQVLTNLLSNAVKYAAAAPDIRVTGWEDFNTFIISISDDGIGIDEEDLPRLFQRYFRAKTSTGIAGTGIGLNLVKQIVELHQGSIAVASKKGQGTTFTITLPTKANGTAVSSASKINAA